MTDPLDAITLLVDGRRRNVSPTLSVAALLLQLRQPARVSVSGQARAAFCGMGVCGECRVTIDGRPGVLACLTPCRDGMAVDTAAPR
jgi:succinate dehydrogenase/fumarate reductase-like Fe-S protein